MKRKHLLTMILASVLICLPCAAQNKSTKKMKITHGKEKAYTGEDVPGELKELRLTIIEDDVETTDVEMKYVANFYEVKYVKNGEKHYKMMARNRVHILESALGDMYKMEDNYPKNTEVHLGTKHEHGVFLLNGVQMTSSQFPIVGIVISFMDNELELVEPNTPFPEGKLTYFHYSNKGSMRPGGPEWTVEREADGRYKVSYFDDRGKFERRTPEKKEKVFDSKKWQDSELQGRVCESRGAGRFELEIRGEVRQRQIHQVVWLHGWSAQQLGHERRGGLREKAAGMIPTLFQNY